MFHVNLLQDYTEKTAKGKAFASLTTEQVNANLPTLGTITSYLAGEAFESYRPNQTFMMNMVTDHHLLIGINEDGLLTCFISYSISYLGPFKKLGFAFAVHNKYQAQGWGTALLCAAVSIHKPQIVVAQSQNPAAILASVKALRQLGAVDVYPITADINSSDDAVFALYLMNTIKSEKGGTSIDPETGIMRQIYVPETGGRLGAYQIKLNNPGIAEIEDRLQQLGLNRDEGDAVNFFAFV